MRYYKITAKVADKEWEKEFEDRDARDELVHRLVAGSEEFNQKTDDRFVFLNCLGKRRIEGGIISRDPRSVSGSARAFFKAIGVKVLDPTVTEITFSSAVSLIRNADRWRLIDDDSIVLETFGLDRLGRSDWERGFDLKEYILDERDDKASRYAAAEDLLAEDTMVPELDRIYSGKTGCKAFGHPVHYYVETDDRETEGAIVKTLLGALYENGRLRSRRYSVVDVCPWKNLHKDSLDQLYGSAEDGAVVIRYKPVSEGGESGYASGEMDAIETVCRRVLEYRNRTLTLVSLPRACAKTKKLFAERLGSLGMVDVRENLAGAERAEAYLKKMCRTHSIRCDRNLTGKLEPEAQYLPHELRKMFEEWYNDKMRTKIFPQYKNVAVSKEEAVREVARGPAIEELNGMIGLSAAKDVIMKALSYYKMQRLYSDRGISQDRPAMHMVFTGNPGTAKTTVARLFAGIMRENGLLSKGHLVEVGRGDLVGKFVGWTAPTVKAKFNQAMGGVLFIDEAYSLADDRGGSFGDEAINTIVQEMENRREDLVVIFAGYPAEMEQFLAKNPGLRSRIAFHVPFADYDSAELCGIARMIAESKGVTLTDGAVARLSVLFDAARTQPDFGNGRYVRNVIEMSKLNQASRIMTIDPNHVTDEILTSIEADDIEIPVIRTAPQKRLIGFAS